VTGGGAGLELRPTRPEDLPALSALFERGFGHPLSPAEWEWKYRRLPGEGRSLVAVSAGGIAAHCGAVRFPARWRGGEASVWEIGDFVGSPGRGGLRPPLVALAHRLFADIPRPGEAPWCFGFPTPRHLVLGRRAFQYGQLPTFQPLAGALAALPEPPADGRVRLEISDSCGDWAEAIWERSAVLGVRRSAAFLNWRYHARPERYYRFYRLFPAGGPEGFAVFAFVQREAWATELWLPHEGDAADAVEWYPAVLAVAADLRACGLELWRFWPGPSLSASLSQALGLAPAGEPQLMGCRGVPGGEDPVAVAAGFTYSMGDYDLA
jgi:hypothetical protein